MVTTKIADIIFVNHDKVLLMQQKKQRAYGSWSLPGGHIETGETPEMAVAREVGEELGITLHQEDFLKKVEHEEDRSDEGKLAVTTFVGQLAPAAFDIQEEELIGFGWFTLDELKRMSSSLRSPWIVKMAEEALAPGMEISQ